MATSREQSQEAVKAVVEEWGFDWVLSGLVTCCEERILKASTPGAKELWLKRVGWLRDVVELD